LAAVVVVVLVMVMVMVMVMVISIVPPRITIFRHRENVSWEQEEEGCWKEEGGEGTKEEKSG
jgi:hypothetical protein